MSMQDNRAGAENNVREKLHNKNTHGAGFDWKTWAARVICLTALLVIVWFLFRYAMSLFLPFLLALLLASFVRPGARFLEKRAGIPPRAGGILLLFALVVGLLLLLIWSGGRLIVEGQRLLRTFQNNSGMVSDWITQTEDFITAITAHIPPLARLRERGELEEVWQMVDARVAQMISDTVNDWSARIPQWVTSMVGGIPEAVVFLVTLLLAAFYFCADGTELYSRLETRMSPDVRGRWQRICQRMSRVAHNYLRAYFTLFLLTLMQLIVGFSLLHLPYVFLPALLISLVDILPVLGVGTVLVPWGIIELIRGQTRLGCGLLILFGVMLFLRQVTEPRIVGKSLGLHPLLTLFAFYVGLKLFGIPGMLFAPAVALLIKSMIGDWSQEPELSGEKPEIGNAEDQNEKRSTGGAKEAQRRQS